MTKFKTGDIISKINASEFDFDQEILAIGEVSYFYRNVNGEKIDKITVLKDYILRKKDDQ